MVSEKLSVVLLLLVALLFPAVASFSPTSHSHRRAAMPHLVKKQFSHNIESYFPLQSSPRDIADKGYNDDAFGLIFLSGGILAKDLDFSGTFLVLSALAATGTTLGTIKFDERIPAAVAFMTLLIAPIESSLRLSGSLGSTTPPSIVEVGLCTVSAAWAFVKWSRQESTQ